MSPDPDATNAYAILGIPREANDAEVRGAYRKLALAYHPDMVGEAEKVSAAAIFNRFTQAYEVLQDEGSPRGTTASSTKALHPTWARRPGTRRHRADSARSSARSNRSISR